VGKAHIKTCGIKSIRAVRDRSAIFAHYEFNFAQQHALLSGRSFAGLACPSPSTW
jgi:hypothetical protein